MSSEQYFVRLTKTQIALLEKILGTYDGNKSNVTQAQRILGKMAQAGDYPEKDFVLVTKSNAQESNGKENGAQPLTHAEFKLLSVLEEIGGSGTANEIRTTHSALQRLYDVGILRRKIFAGAFDYFLTPLGKEIYAAYKKSLLP